MATSAKDAIPETVRVAEGLALRALMDKRHVGPTELAANTKIGTKGYISQVVKGIRPLHLDAATQVARYLGVGIDDFSPRLGQTVREAYAQLPATQGQDDVHSSRAPSDRPLVAGEAKVHYYAQGTTSRGGDTGPWPFKSITPAEYQIIDLDSRRELEAIARGMLIASQRQGKIASG